MTAAAPSGVVTFLFTDIEGSTRRWEADADAMRAALLAHDEVLRSRITAHDLRHTAASLAISAGANPKVVQRMLGHASAALTLDVYADLFECDLDAVAQSVAKMCPRWA